MMKLSDLKIEVYRIAEVETTRQLKARYAEIKPLDMRYKASWQKSLSLLQESKDKDLGEKKPSFETWLSNPPEEYRALFAEAEVALDTFDEKIAKAKQLTQTLGTMAESLDEFAEASLEEVQHLAKAAQRAKEISEQANLN